MDTWPHSTPNHYADWQNTQYKWRNMDSKIIDGANWYTSKKWLSNVQYVILIRYNYHVAQPRASYESSDEPAGQPRDKPLRTHPIQTGRNISLESDLNWPSCQLWDMLPIVPGTPGGHSISIDSRHNLPLWDSDLTTLPYSQRRPVTEVDFVNGRKMGNTGVSHQTVCPDMSITPLVLQISYVVSLSR